jgi:AcrR family transcriptional regulator
MNSLGEEIPGPGGARQAPRRSGRRPGASGTREAIRAAAGRLFAEQGYDRTTMRAVAAAAGVDPKLVAHFFGSKHRLFLDAVELPIDPAAVAPVLLGGDPEGAGERVARLVVGVLEDPEGRRRMTGLVRAAASEPDAARLVRDVIGRELFAPIVEALGVDDAPLRASLLGSQLVGLAMARYVVGVEPLASIPAEEVITALAPTLQRYLTGPLA